MTWPVTIAVSRIIRPGHEEAFHRWADEIDHTAATFPGHRGTIRMQESGGINHLVYQFGTPEQLRVWERSQQRAWLITEGDQHSVEHRQIDDRPDYGTLAGWFTVPNSGTVPKWKTFLTTWAAVYPTLLIISTVVTAFGNKLPSPVQLLINSLTLTALLTWAIMPRVTRHLRIWLIDTNHT